MSKIDHLSGTALVSLHRDASRVDMEPGAPLARHLPRPAATPAVAAAAALSYRRPSRGSRAAVAGIFGARALSHGAQHRPSPSTSTSVRARRGAGCG